MENGNSKMYFTALLMPEAFDKRLRSYKHWMQEKHGCKVGLKSPAHITIAPPFWMPADKEGALQQDMEHLARDWPPFSITTADFAAFPPRTLFVAVQPNPALQKLKNASDHHFRHSGYGMKIESRPFRPHITIATRDLHKKAFAEAWAYFEKQIWVETVAIDGLSLLRYNGRNWDVVFTAPFTPGAEAAAAVQP